MSSVPAPAVAPSLLGGMAQRVAEHDWAATPLGPPSRWPQALRIAVDICLSSRFPMFVWWGPKLINIYNDAYVPMLGARHPRALGRPARDSWDDIWDVVGAQADIVMREGRATWNDRVKLVMERHGYVEDTWFTWSYSPIHGEDGGVAGLFCAVVEETGRVIAERERDQLLEGAQRERMRLYEAFSQAPTFMSILEGPEHVFRFANERYFQLVGAREILGKPVREALPEVVEQGFPEMLDRVYRSGEPYVGEGVRVFLRRHADLPLETRYVDFAYTPLVSRGRIEGILTAGADVTARVLAEERDRFLLSLEDALRPHSDPVAIVHTAARLLGEHLGADRCAYSDVDAVRGEFTVVGDWCREVPSAVGTYRFEDFGDGVLPLMQESRPFVVEDVRVHPIASARLEAYEAMGVRALVVAPLRKAGRFVAALGVHQVEARRWKQGEVELLEHVASRCYESIERARVARALRENESSFRQLADAMPQMVFAASPDGQVDYFNRQWYEYTGLAAGETSMDSWSRVHTPEGLARVAEAWPEALRTGQPYELEYPLRRHDGTFRWHLGRAVPIRDAQGRIVRWFGTNTDIDDRKRIEERLGEALEAEQFARGQAEQASRMKDEFLATLSHELRTPLNAILGWSHMLKRDGASREQLAHGAEVIERNARAQSKIIEDLLDMSAIISGKVRLELEPLDLASAVATAVDTARPTAEAKRLELDVHVDPLATFEALGDPHRLQQVLWNLLSNAIKFTPAGGSIGVQLRRDGERAEICVTDTGEGIAAEFLPYVFDRFRQGDASTTRRHGGLGLGLSIVKQLAELHGGHVVAESDGPGRGTTFLVSLPLMPKVREAAGATTERRQGVDAGLPAVVADDCERLAGLEVLVVDDERDARELVARLLEGCNARVTLAGSAGEAIACLEARRFDVLVSDIGMPSEDGYTLMRRVRGLPSDRNGTIPAMALTAYARGEDRVRAMRAGFQMHAAKPVDPGELIAIVASLASRFGV